MNNENNKDLQDVDQQTKPKFDNAAEEIIQPTDTAEQQTEFTETAETIAADIDDAATAVLIGQIAELETQVELHEAKIKEQQEEVLRSRAEVENMRRRTEQEIDKAKKRSLETFSRELLPVIDNMERAIELAEKDNELLKPMLEGIELTLKTMKDTVSKFGLKEINPEGQPFNPEFHQAMAMQESEDHAPNTVMFVMQKGYELNGHLVRPAMVMVSKAAQNNNEQA